VKQNIHQNDLEAVVMIRVHEFAY